MCGISGLIRMVLESPPAKRESSLAWGLAGRSGTGIAAPFAKKSSEMSPFPFAQMSQNYRLEASSSSRAYETVTPGA